MVATVDDCRPYVE